MITIESVRLRNFRAIREAFFQPKTEGITGLMGQNGAGKSTILTGVIWALYGIRPPGASIASLRRTGTGKDDECSVSVVFQHMGQTVEVIRELKGSNNRAVLNIYVDGIEHTVTSVGAGERWIGERLQIDSTGFLTAFVVRQKELDTLVNARPAERKAVIERLAGVETINEALKAARKDENTAKQTLESLPGSEERVTEAETQVVFLSGEVERLSVVSDDADNAVLEARQQVQALREKTGTFREARTELAEAGTRVDHLKVLARNLKATIDRLAYVETADENFDLDVLREQHRLVAAELKTAQQEQQQAGYTARTSREKASSAKLSLREAETWLAENIIPAHTSEELTQQMEEVSDRLVSARNTQAEASARASDFAATIETLQHSDECPTCKTDLKDKGGVLDTLRATMETQQNIAETAATEIATLEQERTRLTQEIRVAEQASRALAQKETSETILEAEEQKAVSADVAVAALDSTIAELQQKVEEVTTLGLKARGFADDLSAWRNAKAELETTSQGIREAQERQLVLTKAYSPELLEAAEKELASAESELLNRQSLIREASENLATYKSRLEVANAQYRTVSDQWKRKKELLQAVERRALTTEVIDKFRRETIASLTPELSDNASELVAEITDGAFTDVLVDDDFNISVKNRLGQERKVGELSGGEESVVALALRLAIGLLISGHTPELLWLDEVLTAQDTDRRASMLSTVRSLPYKQIILVSHTADAGDIADMAVTVKADMEGGSVLQVSQEALDDLAQEAAGDRPIHEDYASAEDGYDDHSGSGWDDGSNPF